MSVLLELIIKSVNDKIKNSKNSLLFYEAKYCNVLRTFLKSRINSISLNYLFMRDKI